MTWIIQAIYLVTAFAFIYALKQMSHPKTARRGVVHAGIAMAAAVLATFLWPGLENLGLMVVALVVGGAVAWWAAKVVAMTDMPQMVAIYNGMGGGAAGTIAAVELLKGDLPPALAALAVLGGLIGAVSFSGSLVAFAKLQRLIKERPITFPGQQTFNTAWLAVTVLLGLVLVFKPIPSLIALFFVMALVFGVLMTLPIGGADMPSSAFTTPLLASRWALRASPSPNRR